MFFELVVLVVGVFHNRDFCLEGMQLAPGCPTVVAIDCTDAMSTCSCATTSAGTGDYGGCRVSNRCDLGESETCVGPWLLS